MPIAPADITKTIDNLLTSRPTKLDLNNFLMQYDEEKMPQKMKEDLRYRRAESEDVIKDPWTKKELDQAIDYAAKTSANILAAYVIN